MSRSITSIVVAASLVLLSAQAAVAATHRMAIVGGSTVLRVVVDNGTARRIGFRNGAALFEVQMEGNSCSNMVRLIFSDATSLEVNYDVCSDTGFAIGKVYQ